MRISPVRYFLNFGSGKWNKLITKTTKSEFIIGK